MKQNWIEFTDSDWSEMAHQIILHFGTLPANQCTDVLFGIHRVWSSHNRPVRRPTQPESCVSQGRGTRRGKEGERKVANIYMYVSE